MTITVEKFHQEDASNLLIKWMRDNEFLKGQSRYGYDVYLPSLIEAYLKIEGVEHTKVQKLLKELILVFYPAAWELCRRGILRPGVNQYLAQATSDGNAGNGYSITPFGSKWLAESNQDDYVPTEPERFAQMLEPFRQKFGPGFYERAQEAIRCYGAHAYLACCAMCGGASESIMLSAAIAKTKDEADILKKYRSSNGRSTIENILIGKQKNNLKIEYRDCTRLLKYWRDESSHGKKSSIKDNEAFTSLALLLRFAKFVDDNWLELTKS